MNNFLVVSVSLFVFVSCGQKKSELIIGKWKIDDIVTPIDWNKVEPERRAQIQKDLEAHVAIQKSFGYREFFPDGRAVSFDGKSEYTYRWRMNKEETKIYFKSVNGVTEDAFDIETLDKNKFIMTSQDKDGEFRITLMK